MGTIVYGWFSNFRVNVSYSLWRMSYPDPVRDRGAIKNGQASSVVMVVDFLATVIFRPRLVVTSTTSIFSTVFK